MLQIVRANALFFSIFAVFLLLFGLLQLCYAQAEPLLYFSEHRSWLGDHFFSLFTKVGEEYIYLGTLLSFLFVRYRTVFDVILIGISVTILALILKQTFAIDRPYTYFQKQQLADSLNLVKGVTMLTGATSFPSGHTMSGFALFGYFAFLHPNKKLLAVLFFMAALGVGVSRMYLLQHFPADVYAGSICGVLLAMLIYYCNKYK